MRDGQHASKVCQLAGNYQMNFTVTCAPESDCAQLDPNFTEFQVPFILDSKNFCSELEAPAQAAIHAPWRRRKATATATPSAAPG